MATFWASAMGGHERGRVLVVDDEPDIRALLAAALVDEGYDVRQAASGSGALALLAGAPTWRPDVVLVDLLMAPGTGWEFVREYRARWGHRAALLVMTAGGPGALRSAAPLPVDDLLAKPFDVDRVLELVASYLRQRRSLRHPGAHGAASRAS